jgi:hypothetical protein
VAQQNRGRRYIALINSIGNFAGFGGPYLIDWSRTPLEAPPSVLVLAVLPVLAACLMLAG